MSRTAPLLLPAAHRTRRDNSERSRRRKSCFLASTRRAAWSRPMRRVDMTGLLERSHIRGNSVEISASIRARMLCNLRRCSGGSTPNSDFDRFAAVARLPILLFACFIYRAGAFGSSLRTCNARQCERSTCNARQCERSIRRCMARCGGNFRGLGGLQSIYIYTETGFS